MFQNIFYKIQRMQEEYWSTGKYTLDYEWENLSYHIRHLDTDEILLERRREGSSRVQRLVMPLQEFRFCSSQRIFHLLHDFEEPASVPASGVPGSGQIYDSMRVILLEPVQDLWVGRMEGDFFAQQGKKRRNPLWIPSIFDAACAAQAPFRRSARRF